MNTDSLQAEDPLLSSQQLRPVNESSIRLRLMFGVIVLLLLAQGFNAGLSILHFTRLHTDSLVSLSRVNAQSLQRKLGNDINLGKPLDKFFGINAYMQEIMDRDSQVTNVSIASNEGIVLYSLDKSRVGKKLAEPINLDFSEPKSEPESDSNRIDSEITTESVLFNRNYHILLPVKDRDEVWRGTIDISFPEEIIDEKISAIVKRNLQVLAATSLVAALLLFLGLRLFAHIRRGEPPNKKRIFAVVLVVVGVAQILYSSFNIQHFKTNYVDIMQSNIGKSVEALHLELERWLAGGIKIDRLPGLAAWMQEVVGATPEVENMRITTRDGKLLYRATAQNASSVILIPGEQGVDLIPRDQADPELRQSAAIQRTMFEVLEPLTLTLSKGDEIQGYLQVRPSSATLRVRVGEIVADSLTVLVISLLFVIELIIFLLILIHQHMYQSKSPADRSTSDYGLIRPAAFIYLFAMDLPVSFLVLHMADLEPIFGLSPGLANGLPLSVAMFFAMIMIVVSGAWIDRRGWQEPFFVGVVLTAGGACLAGFAETGLEFVVARAIMGIGYGSTYISARGFVFNQVHAPLQNRGITDLTAGFFAGSICGTISGGMLAERLGFSAVFFVSAVMAAFAILFAVIFMARVYGKPGARKADREEVQRRGFLQFIFDRNFFSLVIFSSLPNALLLVGALYYASPIYLAEEDIGQAHIGRIVMLYALCIIFLPRLVRPLVERSDNKRPYIFLSGVFAGLAMFAFYLFEGVAAVIITIGMLGIAGSLGLASQHIYAMNLQAVQGFGQGQAMGIYSSIERLGQVLGPLVLGSMLLLWELEEALALLGCGILLASLVFLLFSKTESAAGSKPGGAGVEQES